MKICDVVQFYSPLGGGVRRYLEDKIHFLDTRQDLEHVMIVPSDRDTIRLQGQTRIYEIKSVRLAGSISYRMLLNKARILSIVEEEKPDIIEVGDPYRSAWIALEASRRLSIPIVAFYHSDFPRALGRTIHRFAGRYIERILSNWIHGYVTDLYNRMSATVVAGKRLHAVLRECGIQKTVCIPLGTDTQVFHPNPVGGDSLRRELGIEEHDRLLLFVGRLAREKNIRRLVGMMEDLNQRHEEFGRYHLLLVGDGELRNYVKQVLRERNDISWHPYCKSSERLTGYYTAADLFVHAGIYETFGITSLEAQACGLRVLAVKSGGLDDTVAGDEPPIMAPSPESGDLAETVRRTMSISEGQTPQQRRERIIDRFSIHQTFERMIALYDHILEGQPVEEFVPPTGVRRENERPCPAVLSV